MPPAAPYYPFRNYRDMLNPDRRMILELKQQDCREYEQQKQLRKKRIRMREEKFKRIAHCEKLNRTYKKQIDAGQISFYQPLRMYSVEQNYDQVEFDKPLIEEIMTKVIFETIHEQEKQFELWTEKSYLNNVECLQCKKLNCEDHDRVDLYNYLKNDVIDRALNHIKCLEYNRKNPFFFKMINEQGEFTEIGVKFICPSDPSKATAPRSLLEVIQHHSSYRYWVFIQRYVMQLLQQKQKLKIKKRNQVQKAYRMKRKEIQARQIRATPGQHKLEKYFKKQSSTNQIVQAQNNQIVQASTQAIDVVGRRRYVHRQNQQQSNSEDSLSSDVLFDFRRENDNFFARRGNYF